MAGLEISKKVSLLGSWNEDIFTDQIIRTISALAKSEKGKKVKILLNETGIKLTRSRFFQENKSTFFSFRDLKHVTKSPDSPQCVLFILSNPDKKYKIVALRCSSDGDANQLVGTFSNIQKKLHSINLELRKRENGNWTLRERAASKPYRSVTDVFSDYRPNGEVVVAPNGNVTSRAPGNDQRHTSEYKGMYVKRGSAGSNRGRRKRIVQDRGKDADDYVIETEVMQHPHNATEIHIRDNSEDMKKIKDKLVKDHRDNIRRQEHDTPQVYSGHDSLPSKTVGHTMGESKRSEIIYAKSALPSRALVYTSKEPSTSRIVSGRSVSPSPNVVYTVPEPSRYHMTTGRSVPPRTILYSTSSRSTAPTTPVIVREPPKIYEARMESPVGYYTNPWASANPRKSFQSELVPVRIWGTAYRMKIDQRSLRSNTSKNSKSSKKMTSEFHYPTTVARAVEDTYQPHNFILRRSPNQIVGYVPRPVTYHMVGARGLRM